MKTNTFKYFGLALMAILMVSFTSCEVEIDSFYDDDNNGAGYYNRSADLCSRTWVSFYRDMDGNYCRQELDFFLDRTDMVGDYTHGHVLLFVLAVSSTRHIGNHFDDRLEYVRIVVGCLTL